MRRFALPKSRLLRKNGEYNVVYRSGVRLRGDNFMLIYRHNDRLGSRLGISIQRKVGNAVRRNRIKRVIRETFRLHRQVFPESSDIVFAVRPGFSLNSMQTVRAAVAGLTGMQDQSDGQLDRNDLTEHLTDEAGCTAKIFLLLVKGYQCCISPLFPPTCRYVPTCSEYAAQAVARYGAVRGIRLAACRILRCHPFADGGYDPLK